MDLEKLKNIDFDSLTIDQRVEVESILKELELRKRKYPLLDIKLNDNQQEFLDAVKERNPDWTPRYKIFVFLGWNGSGKTFTNMYITMLKAMWPKICKKYGLPELPHANLISVNTVTGSNISKNLDRKYLLGTWTDKDIMKFPWYVNKDQPWEIVKKPRWDKSILKDIDLRNWTSISFGTYDQGQSRLQGWEPIWTSMDELPTRFDDLIEIVRGNRNKQGQLFISATPTNYNKKIHDYLFSEDMKDTVFLRQVDSLENEHADHSWMKGLTESDIRIRRFGSFTPPEWLVYANFSKQDNVVPFVDPKKLGSKVRFYWAIDFWWKHPLAFLFIAVDNDWHYYVFDMIHESGMIMKDLAKEIRAKMKKHWINKFEYIVADSAGASERGELKAEWFPTKWIKKKKIGEEKFRAWGILRMNQFLSMWKILVADNCQPLIDEFESHHFRENGTVEKTEDDALDALRYLITEHVWYSEKRETKKNRRKKARKAQKKRKY